jgi:hypothetical protein
LVNRRKLNGVIDGDRHAERSCLSGGAT